MSCVGSFVPVTFHWSNCYVAIEVPHSGLQPLRGKFRRRHGQRVIHIEGLRYLHHQDCGSLLRLISPASVIITVITWKLERISLLRVSFLLQYTEYSIDIYTYRLDEPLHISILIYVYTHTVFHLLPFSSFHFFWLYCSLFLGWFLDFCLFFVYFTFFAVLLLLLARLLQCTTGTHSIILIYTLLLGS